MSCYIQPNWPVPSHVRACVTTREGGVSTGSYASLNLGSYTDDLPHNVQANRARLKEALELPADPFWLKQVHGTTVVSADIFYEKPPAADASVSKKPGAVCVALTADCLPVLFSDKKGTCVAAAHAGWKGLLAGVLEATVQAMGLPTEQLLAWLGPAIGPDAFEVNENIRKQFTGRIIGAESAFRFNKNGKCFADLYQLGRLALQSVGVIQVFGGGFCTVQESRFFSHRRDNGITGRMASLIWLC